VDARPREQGDAAGPTSRAHARGRPYFERPDLHKLSATDAVRFVLMTQRKIRTAFTFDAHFATAGFRIVG
jgi:predicted nucleic acid-binding protein